MCVMSADQRLTPVIAKMSASCSTAAPVVLDCGTGFTKLGFAGNAFPSCIIPTVVTNGRAARQGGTGPGLEDLTCISTGDEAAASVSAGQYQTFPVRQGLVVDWDAMELFWQQCLFKHLGVNPEEHRALVTEPPLNPPESREALAEVFFESFNVAGLCVQIHAICALYASWAAEQRQLQAQQLTPASLTGTVVDVGESGTTVIPVVEGYVLGGMIKALPLGGRDATAFVQQSLRERGGVPGSLEVPLDLCRRIKHHHCYVAPDMLKEFQRFDADPAKYIRAVPVDGPKGPAGAVDVGYERFLAGEVFFTPGMCPTVPSGVPSVPQAIDEAIQACPIDVRRSLYGNIVLSGGSTMLRNFHKRLTGELTGITMKRLNPSAKAIDIGVRAHTVQHYAAWFGASLMASGPDFDKICVTREQYLEHGPGICRVNSIFKDAR